MALGSINTEEDKKNQRQEPPCSEEEEEEEEEEEGTSWRERMKRWLGSPYTKKTALAVVLALTIAAGARRAQQHRRQRRKMKQGMESCGTDLHSDYRTATVAPLSLLLAAIENGSLQRALLGSTRVFFQTTTTGNKNNQQQHEWKRVDLPHSHPEIQNQVLARLSNLTRRRTGNQIPEVSVLPEQDWSHVVTGIVAVLPFVYLALVYRMIRDPMQNGGNSDIQKKKKQAMLESSTRTTFQDVAGLDEAVTEVSEVVQYLQHPATYRRLGARAPRGVLLEGPPGVGKTLLAQAVAGEAQVDSFTACSAAEFVEIYVGRGAARVRDLFAQARAEARANYRRREDGPSHVFVVGVKRLQQRLRQNSSTGWWWCSPTSSRRSSISMVEDCNDRCCSAIIFIDELDALAKTRSGGYLSGAGGGGGSNDEREQTLNQLLTEMDGFYSNDDDDPVTVVVLAATNRADVLDPAIRRRFDRQVHVGYPDRAGREAILKVHARHIRTSDTVDWGAIAEAVGDGNSISGADLRNLVNEAALLAVREEGLSQQNISVMQRHLEHAARRILQMKQWHPTLMSL